MGSVIQWQGDVMENERWFEVEKTIYLNRAKFKSITNPLITVLNSFYDMKNERLQKKKSCLEISYHSALKDIDRIIEIENEKIKIEEDLMEKVSRRNKMEYRFRSINGWNEIGFGIEYFIQRNSSWSN